MFIFETIKGLYETWSFFGYILHKKKTHDLRGLSGLYSHATSRPRMQRKAVYTVGSGSYVDANRIYAPGM